MDKLSDQELINELLEATADSRKNAFSIIYARNFPKIKHMIIQKGGLEEDAKDVFQDTMIAFYKIVKEGKFRGKAQIDTLLFAIARNLWRMNLRKDKTYDDLSLVEKTKGLEEVDFNWDKHAREKKLERLLNELSENCQKLIKLFYYEGWAIESIQAEFNLKTIQASKNKKYRCMKELIEVFKRNNINNSSF